MTRIKGETGFQNADRFVAAVKIAAKDERHLIFYGDKWPWMANKDWRSIVNKKLVEEAVVWNPTFSPPDTLDGWSFYATSRAPVPRAQFTPISEPLYPAESVIAKMPRSTKIGMWLALGLVSFVICTVILYNRRAEASTVLPPPISSEAIP